MFSIFSPHSTTADISYIDFLSKLSYSVFNKYMLAQAQKHGGTNMPEITLDNRSFSLLEYIYNNPYISYASLKTAFPSYNDIEDLVLSFDEQHLISLREASSLETDTDQYETYNLVDSSHLVTITFGNAIIEQAKRRTDEFNTKLKPLYDIADKTASLAESASIRADLAKEQADSASKTSLSAKFKANLSLIFSGVTVICSLLANADKIVHNVQKILSYLGLQ